MKYAAVAVISFFDNEIRQGVIEVDGDADWKETLVSAFKEGVLGEDYREQADWVQSLPDEEKEAKEEFFNGDMAFAITFFDTERKEK